MSVHSLTAKHALDPVTEAKVHLAAAHRLAMLDDLQEGIDNHYFEAMMRVLDRGNPGYAD